MSKRRDRKDATLQTREEAARKRRQENVDKFLGISYRRISDPIQALGDGEDRQDRDYLSFCARHDLIPAAERFTDRISGFRGKHREKGDLGRLIELAKREIDG